MTSILKQITSNKLRVDTLKNGENCNLQRLSILIIHRRWFAVILTAWVPYRLFKRKISLSLYLIISNVILYFLLLYVVKINNTKKKYKNKLTYMLLQTKF